MWTLNTVTGGIRAYTCDAATGPRAKCLGFRRDRKGTRYGYATVQFSSGLVIRRIAILKAGSKIWADPPSWPWIEGNALLLDEDGRVRWTKVITFSTHGVGSNWRAQVVRAVLHAFPDAVDDDAPADGEPEPDSDALEAEEAEAWYRRQQQ